MLRNKRRRPWFAIYAVGLLGEGDRKSAEPIAAPACGDPSLCDAFHARLLHFLTDSVWDDRGVRRAATECGVFLPRPDGRWRTTRSGSRPEPHCQDSVITARLAISRHLTRWLARCA